MEIRFGTILDRFPKNSAKIEIKDLISPRKFKYLKKAIDEINRLKSNKRLLQIVVLNDKELDDFFHATFEEFINKSISWNGVKSEDLDHAFLNSNRLLLNYLTSIRTYIDHISTYLSREFGKESQELENFKKVLSFHFDNSFPYRFFYKLRNFAQHCGVPLDSISFTSDYDRENNKIHGTLRAIFSSTSLLNNYNDWGRVKRDLEELNGDFELRLLRIEMTEIIINIHKRFESIISNKTISAAQYLAKNIKHLRKGKRTICIFDGFETDENGKLSNIRNIQIPIEEIDEILKVYKC